MKLMTTRHPLLLAASLGALMGLAGSASALPIDGSDTLQFRFFSEASRTAFQADRILSFGDTVVEVPLEDNFGGSTGLSLKNLSWSEPATNQFLVSLDAPFATLNGGSALSLTFEDIGQGSGSEMYNVVDLSLKLNAMELWNEGQAVGNPQPLGFGFTLVDGTELDLAEVQSSLVGVGDAAPPDQRFEFRFTIETADGNGGNIPEPGALALLGAGLAGMGLLRRRRHG